MDNRTRIEKELLNNQVARDRILGELNQLEARQAAKVAELGVSILENGEVSTPELGKDRDRREVLEAALEEANRRIMAGETKLHDLKLGEAGAAWKSFETSFVARMGKIRDAIGEQGLNGQLEQLRAEMYAARAAYNREISGEPEHLYQVQATIDRTCENLFSAWQILESLAAYNEQRAPRVLFDKPNYIAGFGKLR